MIGGSSDVDQESMGAFQEFPQVCKYSILLLCILFRVQWFAIITKKEKKPNHRTGNLTLSLPRSH